MAVPEQGYWPGYGCSRKGEDGQRLPEAWVKSNPQARDSGGLVHGGNHVVEAYIAKNGGEQTTENTQEDEIGHVLSGLAFDAASSHRSRKAKRIGKQQTGNPKAGHGNQGRGDKGYGICALENVGAGRVEEYDQPDKADGKI